MKHGGIACSKLTVVKGELAAVQLWQEADVLYWPAGHLQAMKQAC